MTSTTISVKHMRQLAVVSGQVSSATLSYLLMQAMKLSATVFPSLFRSGNGGNGLVCISRILPYSNQTIDLAANINSWSSTNKNRCKPVSNSSTHHTRRQRYCASGKNQGAFTMCSIDEEPAVIGRQLCGRRHQY